MAAPARPLPQTITQPDGTTLTLIQQGDEWHHWLTDLDGNLVVLASDGFYRQANEAQLAEWQNIAEHQSQLRTEVNAHRTNRLKAARQRSVSADELESHFSFPSKGVIRGIVVLVEYQDFVFTIDDPLAQFSDMMMKPGYDYALNQKYVHQGSAHDYFYQNSMGAFDPQFDVYGPLKLKHEQAYYGGNGSYGNDLHPHEMIIEACQQLDSLGVDFSQYDNNNDGLIDFVFAIYAGEGENSTGISNQVWPHAWNMSGAGAGGQYTFDGVTLEDYACTCELFMGKLDGVGTFCHEFSHVLGLPDIYDTNYSSRTPMNYDVLDVGCYLLNSFCPAGYSAYERYELGWLEPDIIDKPASPCLDDFGTTNQALLIPVTPDLADPRDGEYYLFENRQPIGWDQYLPGHGMVVWHIDYVSDKWWYNSVNTWSGHQCVDLVEADGARGRQDGSETFPGTAGHTEFTDDTTPALSGWSYPGTSNSELGNRLEMPITNIQETPDADGLNSLSFDFMGGNTVLQQIEQGLAPGLPLGTVLLDGRLMVNTGNGCYDAMGRRR